MRDSKGRFISAKRVALTDKVKVWVSKEYMGSHQDHYVGVMTVSEMKHFQTDTGQSIISQAITI